MKNFIALLVCSVICSAILSCFSPTSTDQDDSIYTPHPNLTKSQTALQISASIGRRSCTGIQANADGIVPVLDGVYDIECYVKIFQVAGSDTITEYSNATELIAVNTATVTLNGIVVPLLTSGFDVPPFSGSGWYLLTMTSYVPGTDYTVSVTCNGNVYSQTLKAPGGFSADSGVTKIDWVQPGAITSIDVNYYLGSTTYTSTNAANKYSRVLTSPYIIPAKAYPKTSCAYQILAAVSNCLLAKDASGNNTYSETFGPLKGLWCNFLINDTREWRIKK